MHQSKTQLLDRSSHLELAMLPVLTSELSATDILAILILCPSVINMETCDL